MKDPVLSLCVCTYQGSARIRDTLWSLCGQSAETDRYEIIVIDNGSDDLPELERIVRELRQRTPALRLVVEPRVGLSHARNRAVAESRGDYVFFIDDDALAAPRLVEHFLRAISKHSPDVIGGNILPLFEEPPPEELDYQWWPQWSLKHFGSRDRWLDDGEYFLGTNLGATRELLLRSGFEERLGRTAENLMGGEEWFLGDSRFRRRFVAGATVFHQVPAERMTVTYMARRNLYSSLSLSLCSSNPVGRGSKRSRSQSRHLGLFAHHGRAYQLSQQLGIVWKKLSWIAKIRAEKRRLLRQEKWTEGSPPG